MRHLISPLDFTVEETYEVLDFADRIAANPKAYAHARGVFRITQIESETVLYLSLIHISEPTRP